MPFDDRTIEAFKTEVHDKGSEIDPGDEYDWWSLTLGWALGKGMSPDDASSFATHIRYNTSLG